MKQVFQLDSRKPVRLLRVGGLVYVVLVVVLAQFMHVITISSGVNVTLPSTSTVHLADIKISRLVFRIPFYSYEQDVKITVSGLPEMTESDEQLVRSEIAGEMARRGVAMGLWDSHFLVYWTIGKYSIPLLFTFVFLYVYIKLFDRIGRRDYMCSSCGYDLRGLRSDICPECGCVKSGVCTK